MFTKLRTDDNHYKNLLNGDWVTSESKNYIDIISPLDDKIIGKVPAFSKKEVDDAIAGCKAANKSWRETPLNERAKILYKVADLLEIYAEDIANIMVREISKDINSCLTEVVRTADFIRFTADTGKSLDGEAIGGDNFPGGSKSKLSFVSREPLGVVLAISPFNYPVNLSASKIAPALIGGNSVLLKPPTQGSLSALLLVAVFEAAGVPAGVINTVTGRGSEIGDYLITHKDIDFINFTGSSEIGTHISKMSTMVPLLLELGGKDAAIVLDDCDLEDTANNIVSGAYSYSGQRCTAVKRILTTDDVADKLVPLLKTKIEALRVGSPLEAGITVTPLINKKSADFVESLIEDGKEKGAKIITGGKREGNLIYPTLIDNVSLDMRIAWEEPFGPVLPIIRVKTIEEAIEISNKSEYGLQGCVFTNDINKAFSIAKQLEVGTVQINNKPERGPDHFPFSGVKSSGMGTQGVKYSIEAMTRLKGVVFNIKDQY